MCLLTWWCLLAPLGTPPVAGTKTTEEEWGQSPKVEGILGTEPKGSWWQNVPGEEITRVKASEEKTLTRHGPEMNRFRVGIRTERSARWGWTGVLDGSWQKKVNTVFKSVTWEWWQDSQEVEKVTGLTGSWIMDGKSICRQAPYSEPLLEFSWETMNVYAFKWVEANSRDRGMEEHIGSGDGLNRKNALPKIKKQLSILCVLKLLDSWLYYLILSCHFRYLFFSSS